MRRTQDFSEAMMGDADLGRRIVWPTVWPPSRDPCTMVRREKRSGDSLLMDSPGARWWRVVLKNGHVAKVVGPQDAAPFWVSIAGS